MKMKKLLLIPIVGIITTFVMSIFNFEHIRVEKVQDSSTELKRDIVVDENPEGYTPLSVSCNDNLFIELN